MSLKKILPYLSVLPVVLAMACFLALPMRYTESVREGISLWAVSVLPATFPFLFLTAVFTNSKIYPHLTKAVSPAAGKLFRVSGAGGCAAVLSALSGYPVGARTVLDLYERGQIEKSERFRLAALCTTTGPMFMVGAVGARMFQSAFLGWIMLFSHLLAVYSVCVLLRFTAKRQQISEAPVFVRQSPDALMSSVLSVLCVGGSIALFYAFGQMLADLGAFAGIKNPVLCAILRGLLEMTAGCKLLSEAPSAFSLSAACFLVTFGGLCVIVQQLTFLKKADIQTLPFLGVKLVQGVLSALICYGLCLLFGI